MRRPGDAASIGFVGALAWYAAAAASPIVSGAPIPAASAAVPQPAPAASGTPGPVVAVGVRSGNHAGFGRLVLDLPPGVTAFLTQGPATISIRLQPAPAGAAPGAPASFAFGRLPASPRNAGPVTSSDGALSVAIGAAALIRQSRPPGRVVVDFLDPPAATGAAPPAAPLAAPKRVADGPGVSRARRTPPLSPLLPPTASPAPSPVPARSSLPSPPDAGDPDPAIPVVAEPLGLPDANPRRAVPADRIAVIVADPSPPAAAAMPASAAPQADPRPAATNRAMLPIAPRAGVAALRRGNAGLLVVDADGPADPAAWRAVPGLAEAVVTNLPGATVVSFRLAPGAAASVRHGTAGWTLDLSGDPPADASGSTQPAGSIDLAEEPQHLLLATSGASRVISIADPLGGGTLLAGTLRADAAPGQVQAARLLPALALLQTWYGVAVEPLSDSLDMRPVAGGFLLDLGSQRSAFGALADAAAAATDAAGLERRFDLPALPVAALVNRQEAAAEAVAAAPPRGRATAQLRLAETMVALGLGAEAQAVLHLALAADGRLAADPRAVALGGVAALLAGRLGESAGLEDPVVANDLAGRDETLFWRALRGVFLAAEAGQPPAAEVARIIAARQAIVLSYPASLRDRLLPAVAETLAEAAAPASAERLIAAAGKAPDLDYARALLDIRGGRVDAALDRLDRLAGGIDRNERARAGVRAAELRLATGRVGVAAAADRLDGLVAAWRGGDRELRLRLRVAELRAQAGQFRGSLAMLRDTLDAGRAGQWPPARLDTVRDRLASVFVETLAHDDAAPMPPLEFVSLIEDNADLLPRGADGERVARRVADRLAALDLPELAGAALRHLMDAAPPGTARASLGATLAAMQVQQGDASAALVSLSASTAEALPQSLVAERAFTYARAAALHGDVDAATGALAALDTPAADTLRTDLLERAGRWPDATAALARRVAADVPPYGKLGPDGAALVLRLASAAAQAADAGVLEQLRTDYLPRLPYGPGSDMLRVLTEGPVRSVADLPRAAQEAALARSVIR